MNPYSEIKVDLGELSLKEVLEFPNGEKFKVSGFDGEVFLEDGKLFWTGTNTCLSNPPVGDFYTKLK